MDQTLEFVRELAPIDWLFVVAFGSLWLDNMQHFIGRGKYRRWRLRLKHEQHREILFARYGYDIKKKTRFQQVRRACWVWIIA